MIDSILRYTIPAAMDVLPPEMSSPAATAMLLAIGLQESRFLDRRQHGGPARGFWQFELAGVEAVLHHDRSAAPIAAAMRLLRYPSYLPTAHIHGALEHNDTLACCFARCLLWTSSRLLPQVNEPKKAWNFYLATWRPGQPHEQTWAGLWAEAWERTTNVGNELRKV